MAEIFGKDEATYTKERDGFLRDLRHFHETRGTPFKRSPLLGSKRIDLYLLYNLVTAEGGWMKVNSKNYWSDFLKKMGLPQCVNGSIALKQIYLRYLDRWEKVHYMGDEGDRGGMSDDDEESRHKRWSARALHSVPHAYNYSQHNVAVDKRDYNHMDVNIYKQSDYDRLALSLISPLPNEQDFAINVCTLLSNDSRHMLKLDKHPRIINYLLAHAGVFDHSSLRRLFIHFYSDIRKKPLHTFWNDILESDEFSELTMESKFYSSSSSSSSTTTSSNKEDSFLMHADKHCDTFIKDSYFNCVNIVETTTNFHDNNSEKLSSASIEFYEVQDNVSECNSRLSDANNLATRSLPPPPPGRQSKYFLKYSSTSSSSDSSKTDKEIFCLRRTLGTQDHIGQRVLQIATILRNLSFIDENVPVLTKNITFIRFIILCANSQWGTLRTLGLEMLGNIATDYELKDSNIQSQQQSVTDLLGAYILKIISRNLQSDDRSACLSSVEVLNKLSQNENNEDILQRSLDLNIYKKVCSFLTLHDVMLLIYTLECLYSLSSLGERSCNFIAMNHGVIDTLVSLVTVEGKSYGPKACIGMKLVETIPTGSGQQQLQSNSQLTTNTSSVNTSSNNNIQICTLASPPSAPGVTPVKILPTTPIRNVPVMPQRLLTATIQAISQQPVNVKAGTTGVSAYVTRASNTSTTSTASATAAAVSAAITGGSSSALTPVSSSSLLPPSSSSSSSSTSLTPQQMIEQQHAHQQAIHENEQLALAWLRATYEPCASSGAKIDHQELYRHYINSCSKIGRPGVISPLHFPRCVRSVFGGTVGPNPMKPANSNDPQYYEGIKVREQPLKLNIVTTPAPANSNNPLGAISNAIASPLSPNPTKPPPVCRRKIKTAISAAASPTPVILTVESVATAATETQNSPQKTFLSPVSPILKAQLSAPPKQRSDGAACAILTTQTSSTSESKSQAVSHPHLSQALLGTLATTSTNQSITSTSTGINFQSSPSLKFEIRHPQNNSNNNNNNNSSSSNSSSLIKSLLATKVNDACSVSTSMSMKQMTAAVVTSTATTTNAAAAATDCQNVAQVAARQQRLLAQQSSSSTVGTNNNKTDNQKNQTRLDALKMHRINGVRQLFTDTKDVADSVVSSTSQFVSTAKGKKEPPQPPPPPLAPLSISGTSDTTSSVVNTQAVISIQQQQESGSSLTISSSSGAGADKRIVSSIVNENNDNSLISFEGLLNGMPIVEESLNESNSSKDLLGIKLTTSTGTTTTGNEICIDKPLRLADLLEKKIDTKTSSSPFLANGSMSKDLLIKLNSNDKKELLIENHIEKVLTRETNAMKENQQHIVIDHQEDIGGMQQNRKGIKRSATDEIVEAEAKRFQPINNNNSYNGSSTVENNNAKESAANSPSSALNGDGDDAAPVTVSTAAAKLFADMAADILEDEEDEVEFVLQQNATSIDTAVQNNIQAQQQPSRNNNSSTTSGLQQQQQQQQQIVVDNNQSAINQVLAAASGQSSTRQIIVSQAAVINSAASSAMCPTTPQSVVISSGTQLKPTAQTATGQTVIVQNANVQQRQSVLIQPASAGQLLLSQSLQGQNLQLIAGSQPGQYVLQTNPSQGYVVAQPQTAVVHGQTQTVLVAQQSQTTGGAKTIIILQQQSSTAGSNQKVVVAPHQGQQVVVTQVPRPIAHPSTISNNNNTTTPQIQKTTIIRSGTVSSIGSSSSSSNNTISSNTTTTSSSATMISNNSSISKDKHDEKIKIIRDLTTPFVCEWGDCTIDTKFKSANEVYMHACKIHCPLDDDEISCEWDGCDTLKRKRFSLMTHLHDKHCNSEAMKQNLLRRKKMSQGINIETSVTQTATHPGYAPDAALHAIKRHALEFVNPKELQIESAKQGLTATIKLFAKSSIAGDQDDNEGPVTKSMRLTASLILRNLVIYSSNCKRYLKSYESHLANIALSNVESSRTIAQILYDMNDGTSNTNR